MKQRVWIVEMWNHGTGQWEPTTGASLSRAVSRLYLVEWQRDNPDTKFRVCRYERQTREARR